MDNVYVLAWILPGLFFWLLFLNGDSFGKSADYKLISVGALLGIAILFVTRFIVASVGLVIGLWQPLESFVRTLWHKILPGQFTFSFLFSFVVAIILYRLFVKEREQLISNWLFEKITLLNSVKIRSKLTSAVKGFSWLANFMTKILKGDESKISNDLLALSSKVNDIENEVKPPMVMFTLKDGKVYVGHVIGFEVEGEVADNFVRIIPLVSGQRAEESEDVPDSNKRRTSKRLIWTTFYIEKLKNSDTVNLMKMSNGEYISLVIMFCEIQSFTQFDLKVRATFDEKRE